jgi:hypothetical protein
LRVRDIDGIAAHSILPRPAKQHRQAIESEIDGKLRRPQLGIVETDILAVNVDQNIARRRRREATAKDTEEVVLRQYRPLENHQLLLRILASTGSVRSTSAARQSRGILTCAVP